MPNTSTATNDLITREVFEAYIQGFNSRLEADEKLDDMRIKKIEAIMDKNMADINGAIKLLSEHTAQGFNMMNERLNSMNERITSTNERISHIEKLFDEKLEHVTDTLTVAINNLDNRITDMKEELKHAQNNSIAKLGIAIAIFVGAIQVAVAVVLHFWG